VLLLVLLLHPALLLVLLLPLSLLRERCSVQLTACDSSGISERLITISERLITDLNLQSKAHSWRVKVVCTSIM
jgi:hypothetical protein